jgi:hypothetical protein
MRLEVIVVCGAKDLWEYLSIHVVDKFLTGYNHISMFMAINVYTFLNIA